MLVQRRIIPYCGKAKSTRKSDSKRNCSPHTAYGKYGHFNPWQEYHPVSYHQSLITQCYVALHLRRTVTSTAPLQKSKNSCKKCKTCILFPPRNPAVCLKLYELQYASTDWLGSISHTSTEYNILILTNGQAVAICCIKQILSVKQTKYMASAYSALSLKI